MIRYPSLKEFVPGWLSATPVAGVVARLDEPTRAAILQEVKTSLQPYQDDDGVAAPIEAHVALLATSRRAILFRFPLAGTSADRSISVGSPTAGWSGPAAPAAAWTLGRRVDGYEHRDA